MKRLLKLPVLFSGLAIVLIGAVYLIYFSGYFDQQVEPSAFYSDPDMIALCKAAMRGKVRTIDRLVAKGVDINKTGKENATPLLFALYTQNKESFEALIKHGANPNIMLKNSRRGDAIHAIAAEVDDPEWLELAFKYGADPNSICSYPSGLCSHPTPIFKAIRRRHPENVRVLIENGADINHQDSCGDTPLITAGMYEEYRVMDMLLKAGADWTIMNNNGNTFVSNFLKEEPVSDYNTISELIAEQREYRWKILQFLEEKGIDVKKAKRLQAAADRRAQDTP